LALSIGASAAFGQTEGDTLVQAAFEGLRRQSSIWLRLTGTETIDGRGVALLVDTFWYFEYDLVTGQPTAKLESLEYRGGVLASRTVGDGVTLWSYSVAKNEYNATVYGSLSSSARPPSYLQTLLQGFGTHAKGQSIHVARLLREVYAGGFARYRPWLIGSQEAVLNKIGSFNDPVLGSARTYTSTPNTIYVVSWNGSPATRSLAFELSANSKRAATELTAVYYADASRIGTGDRLVEWRMAVQPVSPFVGNFAFVPPAGAKSIARQGGGAP
jgi:hypothetical protein